MRRHVLVYDDLVRPQYDYPTMNAASPRKWTTFSAPTSLMGFRYLTGDKLDNYSEWGIGGGQFAGKTLVPYNGENIAGYLRHVAWLKREGLFEASPYAQIVSEYEVAMGLRGYSYRIVFVRDGTIVSKFGYDYRPAQVNIFVNPVDMRIIGLGRG